MTELPSGTVTFLFTDIEGSTRLWEEHPEAMQGALACHDAIVGEAVAAHGGTVVKTTGDGVHAVFPLADAGVALHSRRSSAWPAKRGALPDRSQCGWGSTRGRASSGRRLLRLGPEPCCAVDERGPRRPGRHLAADRAAAQESLDPGVVLVHLGEHRLRDLAAPIRVFQVTHADLRRALPTASVARCRHRQPPGADQLLRGS